MMHDNKRLEKYIELALLDEPIESMDLSDREKMRVKSLRATIVGLRIPTYSAPDSLISVAKSIYVAPERNVLRAIRTSPNFHLAGARSGSVDAIAASFQAGELLFRVDISRQEQGWTLLAKLNERGWELEVGEHLLVGDPKGRFELNRLEDVPDYILLTKGQTDVYVPLNEELKIGELDQSHSGD